MIKNDNPVSKTDNPISKYREISGFVWDFFKKYLPTDADLTPVADDVHELDQRYKGTDYYKFMQKLLKVYFDELNELKGAEHGRTENS